MGEMGGFNSKTGETQDIKKSEARMGWQTLGQYKEY